MRWRTVIRLLALAGVFTLAMVAPSTAGPFTRSPLKVVSVPSPFAGCDISGQPGVNFLNSEVEPWVEVNPTDPNNIIAVWQQDRWSNGGARGLLTAVSHDGGAPGTPPSPTSAPAPAGPRPTAATTSGPPTPG
jgi:hypothetical protein